MTKNKSITVLYPNRGIGGAQILFARVAEFFCRDSGFEVTVIDYRDGYISKFLDNRKYHFRLIPFGEYERISLPNKTVCLTPLSHWDWFGKSIEAEDETRVFLWDIHPFNLVEHTAFSGLYKNLSVERARSILNLLEKRRSVSLRRLVEKGTAQQGIAFMCGKNYEYNQRLFGIQSSPNYLPIPIVVPEIVRNTQMPCEGALGRLEIGWLSRLDDRKTRVLFGLLEDIATYQKQNVDSRLSVHVIGIGYKSSAVADLAKSLGVSIHMAGPLKDSALDEYIKTAGINLAFSIGTSALEFAVRGVPTVLTPGSVLDDIVGPAKYRWLFDSEDYDLSSEPHDVSRGVVKGLNEIVREIKSPGAFLRLGRLCRQYAIDNHALPGVMNRLLEYIYEDSFTLGEMRGTGVFENPIQEKFLFLAKDAYKKLFRRYYHTDAFIYEKPA